MLRMMGSLFNAEGFNGIGSRRTQGLGDKGGLALGRDVQQQQCPGALDWKHWLQGRKGLPWPSTRMQCLFKERGLNAAGSHKGTGAAPQVHWTAS